MSTRARPKLSIIVVNWNTLGLLRDALASVFATKGDLQVEVIVIDNGSTDGSAEMVRAEFPDCVLIANPDNRGFAAANNQGFRIAHGCYILMLNSDTIVLGDVLAASARYLDTHPKAGAMGCRVLNPDRTMQITCQMWPNHLNLLLQASGLWHLPWPRFFGRFEMMDWKRDSERPVDSITGCYLMVRHEILDMIGVLDEQFFFFGEETDLCRRMRDTGWTLMFAPVGEIVHYGSASARKLNHKRDILLTDAIVRLHRKHGGAVAAAGAWAIMLSFNLSRAAFWGLRSVVQRKARNAERSKHYRQVVMGQLGL